MENRKMRKLSITLGLLMVLIMMTYSVVTIQGTGAWFSQNSDLTTDEEITVGTLVATFTFSQEATLLQADGLLPGESGPERTLTVTNAGDADFDYWFIADIAGLAPGPELCLSIIGPADAVVYDGPLSDFAAMTPRALAKTNSEILTFKVYLTKDADDAYQGLEVSVSITFHAVQDGAIDDGYLD